MRVLVVHTHYRQRGGEDAVVESQVELLRSRGHEVEVFSSENPESIRSPRDIARVIWNSNAANALEQAIGSTDPDVVHVHNTWFAMSPSVVQRAANAQKPVVATLHNFRLACANALLLRDGRPCERCVGSSPVHAVRFRCYRGVGGSLMAGTNIEVHRRLGTWTGNVSRFLVMSRFSESLFARHGVSPDRMRVLPQSVSDPGDRSAPPSSSSFVLFVGRLSHEKGIDVLLEAWSKATRNGLHLYVVGTGQLERELQAAPPPGVRFLGRLARPEVMQLMMEARAVFVPSICYEGQPMVVVEAMAAGVPAVGSDHGGLGEYVRAIDEGCAVKPGDVLAWSRAIDAVARGDSVDVIGAAGRRLYSTYHRPEKVAEALEDVYSEAIAEGPLHP